MAKRKSAVSSTFRCPRATGIAATHHASAPRRPSRPRLTGHACRPPACRPAPRLSRVPPPSPCRTRPQTKHPSAQHTSQHPPAAHALWLPCSPRRTRTPPPPGWPTTNDRSCGSLPPLRRLHTTAPAAAYHRSGGCLPPLRRLPTAPAGHLCTTASAEPNALRRRTDSARHRPPSARLRTTARDLREIVLRINVQFLFSCLAPYNLHSL